MKYVLRAKTHSLRGSIDLPGSKSISNRILIIQALAKRPFELSALSEADDTKILMQALERNDIITDVGPAGTAMRFLTAYYAGQPGEKVLTGSERMKQRPIAILVDALNQLGAKISYLEREGYPPLHIEGRRLHGGKIKVNAKVSSQFITALMLIGPTLPQALEIQIEGDPLSRPYILMTQSLMQQCGAQVSIDNSAIKIMPGRYRSSNFTIERDWSAAAFWMAFGVLAKKTDVLLKGLTSNTLQGDQAAIELFQTLGLTCEFEEGGLRLKKNLNGSYGKGWNFRNTPDLVQPTAFAAAALGISFKLEGLDNLRLKETDRIEAIVAELKKLEGEVRVSDNQMEITSKKLAAPKTSLSAYDDHRMVMALSPLSMCFPSIIIENPMVVAKSYPGFWKQVEKFVDVRPLR